jgi:hypothetical protein
VDGLFFVVIDVEVPKTAQVISDIPTYNETFEVENSYQNSAGG